MSKLKMTLAGVAFSADARSKLQQVARWMKDELKGNQDPTIRLGHSGGLVINTTTNVTILSPFGVLVQMFNPLNVVDLKDLGRGQYVARLPELHGRAMKILGITPNEFLRMLIYLYGQGDWSFQQTIQQLRALK